MVVRFGYLVKLTLGLGLGLGWVLGWVVGCGCWDSVRVQRIMVGMGGGGNRNLRWMAAPRHWTSQNGQHSRHHRRLGFLL